MKPLSRGSLLLERKVFISYESEMPRQLGGGGGRNTKFGSKLVAAERLKG